MLFDARMRHNMRAVTPARMRPCCADATVSPHLFDYADATLPQMPDLRR